MSPRWDVYNQFFAITPDDAVNIPEAERPQAIYVGSTGGPAVLVLGDDSTITVTGLLAGTIYPFTGVKRVNATGTTATPLISLRSV